MKSLTAQDMLNVWEQGLSQPLLQQALILLVAACPEIKPNVLAELSIGQRDRRLFQLRARLFGERLINTAVCPACSERLEWENKVTDLLIPVSEMDGPTSNQFDLTMEDYHLRFRLPNSLDIADALKSNDSDKAQQDLLAHCILDAKYVDTTYAVDQLPEHVIETLTQRIEELDPQAEVCINLDCPECAHSWDILFDISSFLWSELNDWAEQTLQMIHKLAQGYGWTEQEILNLSPVRRQLYLGMLRT